MNIQVNWKAPGKLASLGFFHNNIVSEYENFRIPRESAETHKNRNSLSLRKKGVVVKLRAGQPHHPIHDVKFASSFESVDLVRTNWLFKRKEGGSVGRKECFATS